MPGKDRKNIGAPPASRLVLGTSVGEHRLVLPLLGAVVALGLAFAFKRRVRDRPTEGSVPAAAAPEERVVRELVAVGAPLRRAAASPDLEIPAPPSADLQPQRSARVLPSKVAPDAPRPSPGIARSQDLPSPARRLWVRIEGGLVFGLPLVLYLVVGWFLVFRYASYNGDATARLANAYYVLFSRDPHLAAIGFVWNPLPSLSVMLLLPLKVLWRPLASQAFAGNIMSAVFMAGAGYQLYGALRDLGVRRLPGYGLLVLFVANPMIFYYGGNGMSEGLFIFTLVIATRYLARWLVEDRSIWLVVSAAALGFAYLARNEAAFAALFSAGVVVVVSYVRNKADRRDRIYMAVTDGFIFSLPFALCFFGWAIVSWVIVGHPFEQFQSVYGTASQLRVINAGNPVHLSRGQALSRALHAANAMAPALPLFGALALLSALRRKDPRVLAPIAMLGGVLLFAILAYAAGQTAGWFRYYIMAIPLVVMLSGSILANRRPREHQSAERTRVTSTVVKLPPSLRMRVSLAAPVVISLLVLAGVAAGVPSTMQTLLHGKVASEEQLHLDYIVQRHPDNVAEEAERLRYETTVKIARALDDLHLRHGALLVDNFTPCVPYIVLESRHPQQFIIPNDQDFQPSLADPVTFHVQYLLAPGIVGYGSLDAVNREYPTLHANGAGIATFVRSFGLPGCPELSLFRINLAGPS